MNALLDIYEILLDQLDDQSAQLREDCHSVDIKLLFDIEYQIYETYPKSMMKAQTLIIQMMRAYLHDNEEVYNEAVQDTIQFVENMYFMDKELFQ